MEKLITLGTTILFIGIVLILIGSLTQMTKGKTEVKSAGIIFLGPIPFGWASDKKMFYTLLGITAVMILLYILFFKKI